MILYNVLIHNVGILDKFTQTYIIIIRISISIIIRVIVRISDIFIRINSL
jgi:hypothetical protein